ncbi:unnamed protein product [Closterium sp. NIES-54]
MVRPSTRTHLMLLVNNSSTLFRTCVAHSALPALPHALCLALRAARLLPIARPARCPARALLALPACALPELVARSACMLRPLPARYLHRPRAAFAACALLAPPEICLRAACTAGALPAHRAPCLHFARALFCATCTRPAHAAVAAKLLMPPALRCPALSSRAALPEPCRAAQPRCVALPNRPTEPPCLAAQPSYFCCRNYLLLLLLPLVLPTMATLNVLTLDAEGHAIRFDCWLEDLQQYLQSMAREDVSLIEHTSGSCLAPEESADRVLRTLWLMRDAATRLSVRNALPLD